VPIHELHVDHVYPFVDCRGRLRLSRNDKQGSQLAEWLLKAKGHGHPRSLFAFDRPFSWIATFGSASFAMTEPDVNEKGMR